MSIVKGTFSLNCDKCGKQHDFAEDDADFDATSGSERQMGPENGYSWEINFNCDKCGNEIDVEYEIWEYPVGAFNNDQLTINGGTEISRFDYDFSEEPDQDDMYEQDDL